MSYLSRPHPPTPSPFDAAGELFRNIVVTTEGPLNPPILGYFEDMLPQNDAAGELFRNIVRTAESPLNPPILGDFEFLLPQSWGLGGFKKPSELTIFPNVKFASSIQNWGLGGLKNPRFIANISKC